MANQFHLSMTSSNAKTGPIPVSTTSNESCPESCPFNGGNGCYAASGPLAMHWAKVTKRERGVDLDAFIAQVESIPYGSLWRHNQAGDLPGLGDTIDVVALAKITRANIGRKGFTYTHKPLTADNLAAIRQANADGFTVNISANSAKEAAKVRALTGLPTVCVLPSDTTAPVQYVDGQQIVTCPATIRDNTNCARCRLCQKQDRKFIVGFPAHGTSKKKANAVACA